VVGEHRDQLSRGKTTPVDVGEGGIGGTKDGQSRSVGNSVGKIGKNNSFDQGGEASIGSSGGYIIGEKHHTVDDVDDTIGANHVGGHDVSQEGTSRDGPGELDVVTRADGVDLGVDSVAQVDIGWVVQEGGGNVGTRGQVSGENAAGENMVLKDSSHQGNLVGIDVGLLKGGVVGGKHSEGTVSRQQIQNWSVGGQSQDAYKGRELRGSHSSLDDGARLRKGEGSESNEGEGEAHLELLKLERDFF